MKYKINYLARIAPNGEIKELYTIAADTPAASFSKKKLQPAPARNDDFVNLSIVKARDYFFSKGSDGYNKCLVMLQSYHSFNNPFMFSIQYSKEYNPHQSMHANMVKTGEPISPILVDPETLNIEEYKPGKKSYEETVDDLLFALTNQDYDLPNKVERVLDRIAPDEKRLHQMKALAFIIEESINELKKVDEKIGEILEFTYIRTEYSASKKCEIAVAFSEEYGCSERTYYRRLDEAIKRFALYVFGAYPEILNDKIFTFEDGEIHFIYE